MCIEVLPAQIRWARISRTSQRSHRQFPAHHAIAEILQKFVRRVPKFRKLIMWRVAMPNFCARISAKLQNISAVLHKFMNMYLLQKFRDHITGIQITLAVVTLWCFICTLKPHYHTMALRKTSTHAKVHTSWQKLPAGNKMKIASTATSDSTATTTAHLNLTALSSPENSVTVLLLANGIGLSSMPSDKMKKSYFNWSSIKAQELLIELVIEHKPFAAT